MRRLSDPTPLTRAARALVFLLLVPACAGHQTLTRRDVLLQYDAIDDLARGIVDARGRRAALLAPKAFQRSEELLERAVDSARAAHKVEAEHSAREGLLALASVDHQLDVALVEFEEVLQTRERAEREGAAALLKEGFETADHRLTYASRLLEERATERARAERPGLIERYAALELQAIERDVVQGAELSVREAAARQADRYAPRTLAEAAEEVRLARAIVQSDRARKEEAKQHAHRAIWLSGRARSLAALAEHFERDGAGYEDVLLWHQRQLERIDEPLEEPLPFDQSDRAAVLALRDHIASLLEALDAERLTSRLNEKDIEHLQQQLVDAEASHAQKLAELAEASGQQLGKLRTHYEAQLGEQARQQREAELQHQYVAQRVERVRALFKPEEAVLTRVGDDVRIDVYGFAFRPGRAQLGTQNLALVTRLVSAVRAFPGRMLEISGHTDAIGGDQANMELSLARADEVANFLIEVGGIDRTLVRALGFGESRPITSNDTREGRLRNRRVEILIVGAASSAPGTPAKPASEVPPVAQASPSAR